MSHNKALYKSTYTATYFTTTSSMLVSDIAIFVLKRDVKLQLTQTSSMCSIFSVVSRIFAAVSYTRIWLGSL